MSSSRDHAGLRPVSAIGPSRWWCERAIDSWFAAVGTGHYSRQSMGAAACSPRMWSTRYPFAAHRPSHSYGGHRASGRTSSLCARRTGRPKSCCLAVRAEREPGSGPRRSTNLDRGRYRALATARSSPLPGSGGFRKAIPRRPNGSTTIAPAFPTKRSAVSRLPIAAADRRSPSPPGFGDVSRAREHRHHQTTSFDRFKHTMRGD